MTNTFKSFIRYLTDIAEVLPEADKKADAEIDGWLHKANEELHEIKKELLRPRQYFKSSEDEEQIEMNKVCIRCLEKENKP